MNIKWYYPRGVKSPKWREKYFIKSNGGWLWSTEIIGGSWGCYSDISRIKAIHDPVGCSLEVLREMGYLDMIKKKEDEWICSFIPQYSPKGRRLYHRKASLTPIQRVTSEFFDRFKEEGILASESPECIMGLTGGFMVSFMERDGKHKGLAYRKDFRGNDIQLETPWTPTRKDADGILNQYIRAYNK